MFDFLQWMDPDVSAAYRSVVRTRSYRAGQIIYLQGDAGTEMFRLLSGSVRMAVSRPDGREIVYTIFKPGDCFGDSSLVDEDPRPQTAEALTEVNLEVLDLSSFKRLREQFRNFDDALLKLLARQMRFISMHYADANLSSLAVRLAIRISNAVQAANSTRTRDTHFVVPLSQSELAAMVGTSRQSVNKVLQAFQAEGLLRIEYGNLKVLDLDRLRERAAQAD